MPLTAALAGGIARRRKECVEDIAPFEGKEVTLVTTLESRRPS
jgi:hypothetical protein